MIINESYLNKEKSADIFTTERLQAEDERLIEQI